MKNVLMYDEADLKTFLRGLGASDDTIRRVVREGHSTDSDTNSLIGLNTNIASGSDSIIVTRIADDDIHTLTVTSGAFTKSIDINAKVPPRNDKGFRDLLKELGYE